LHEVQKIWGSYTPENAGLVRHCMTVAKGLHL
jgi:hypothetical protein